MAHDRTLAPRNDRNLWREILGASDRAPIRIRSIFVAAFGMGIPVFAGLWLGHGEAGFTIGLGAILLSGATGGTGAPSGDRDRPSSAILPAMLAVTIATLIAGRPWTDAAMIGLVSVAALSSGFSRPFAIGAIRFGIYLVLGAGFLDGATNGHHDAALAFGLGALWNIVLRGLLADRLPKPDEPTQPARVPTLAQRRAHFRNTLRSLAGWQFVARLAIGLTVASVIRHLWPDRHFYWIMLTVVLLTQRPIEHLPIKTVQRLIGTIAGVGITSLIVADVTSPPVLALLACLLATLVPVARARSYLLYSIVATPLILLVLDLGKPVEVALLTDRVVATIIGGALVIAGNITADRLLNRSASMPGRSRSQ
jgi:hypothetical protein